MNRTAAVLLVGLTLASACGGARTTYHSPVMDFGVVERVAIMPLANLSRTEGAADRVRDVLTTMILATGAIYVVPRGEVARGIDRLGVRDPTAPSAEEVVKLGPVIGVEAVLTGVVREYGEVRSGSASANVISLSLQMLETQTGKVVWSASTSKGGVGLSERMLGGGGQPMNAITEAAVAELIKALFKVSRR